MCEPIIELERALAVITDAASEYLAHNTPARLDALEAAISHGKGLLKCQQSS